MLIKFPFLGGPVLDFKLTFIHLITMVLPMRILLGLSQNLFLIIKNNKNGLLLPLVYRTEISFPIFQRSDYNENWCTWFSHYSTNVSFCNFPIFSKFNISLPDGRDFLNSFPPLFNQLQTVGLLWNLMYVLQGCHSFLEFWKCSGRKKMFLKFEIAKSVLEMFLNFENTIHFWKNYVF